jgi:cephalosporin-C deacetylase-like acetyl esterase
VFWSKVRLLIDILGDTAAAQLTQQNLNRKRTTAFRVTLTNIRNLRITAYTNQPQQKEKENEKRLKRKTEKGME